MEKVLSEVMGPRNGGRWNGLWGGSKVEWI